ncbi:MAG: hypothetical protein GY856_05215, partial [bacterium]|nr:hypothetical protein [bacterium]
DTGNRRLVCFPAASGGTPRAIVVSAHGLSFSQPCGVSVDDEDRLLVTDRERNTVFRLTTDGTLLEFWDLECLVQHSLSWAYQAPIDGTVRFSAGLEVEPTIPHLGQEAWRVTAAGELRIEGSGGRIKREPVPVGSVLLVREGQSVEGSERLAAIARKKIYHPDLARLVRFDAPVRAVVDSRGLMAVADGGNDRIRLVRVRTNLDVNLIELGGSEPDISRRMRTRADWESDLGLKLAVGDNVDCFGESYESFTNPETEGTEDFIRERFCRRDVLRSQPNGKVNAAVNVLKVVRQAQRWHRHLTAAASEEQDRWGRTALTFFADLSDSVTWSSSYSLRDFIGLARDLSGRGSDAWDDSVVVHEMAHWIFSHLLPRPAYLAHAARYGRTLRESAGDHWANEITSQDLALNDGFSEFAELFWGDITDRVRGYPSSVLRTVWRGLAHDRDRLDLFEVPGRGLENEGYFTNTVWQIFHALVDPGILFADCPAHWYPRNLCLTETQSRRYVDLLRKPLRSFAAEGLPEHPVAQYLTEILVQAHAGYSEFVRIIQSIFELNNQLMPEIAVSEGPDNPDVGEEVEVPRTERKSLIVRVKDASGEALAGYNLRFHVGPGDPGHFSASGGAEVRHGRRSLSPEETAARDWLQATDGEGAVELEFTAPADAGAEELQISYQPVFATDETFTQSPQDDDDWETTLRKLYLRALGRVGPPAHQGAEVTRTMTFRIL